MLFLRAFQVKRTHGNQVCLDIGPFCQKLASKFRCSKGLHDVFPLIPIGVERVLHGLHRLVVRIGI